MFILVDKNYSELQPEKLVFALSGDECRDIWLLKMLRLSKGRKLRSKQGTYTPSKPRETIREKDCEMLSSGQGTPSAAMTS